MSVRLLLSVLGACGVLSTQASAQTRSLDQYREFALGTDLASVAKITGADSATAKIVHRRPAEKAGERFP